MLNLIEKTKRHLIKQGREILNLTSGNPMEAGIMFPMERLQRLYAEYFQAPYYQPHPKGIVKARQSLADFYSSRSLKLSSENFILTSGTSESFFYLFRLLAREGQNFLVPRPSYPLFEHLAELARVKLKFYNLDEKQNWAIDFESLKQAVDKNSQAVLLISPHNPTGAVASVGEISQLAQICREKNLPLLCDEVFSDFYFENGPYPRAAALEDFPVIFTLNGISKRFALPMMKLGWIGVGGSSSKAEGFLDELETYADTFLSSHAPIQVALPHLLKDCEDFVENYQREVKKRLYLALKLLKEIPGIRFIEPKGGFYLTFKVLDSKGLEEEAWVLKLLQETNVLVHPGYFFDYEDGVHGVMSFLKKEKDLERGIERLRIFLSVS